MSWETTENRIVTFFDIMGFKDWVQKKSHSTILKKMEKLSFLVSAIDDHHSIKAHGAQSHIKTVTFSDSIVLISKDGSIASAAGMMLSAAFLFKTSLELEIPIKGCMSYGKFTADFKKSIYFGQPLIDAYLLQEEISLYSIVLHNSFEAQFKNKKYHGKCISDSKRWIKYVTPLRRGNITHYHLNWTYYLEAYLPDNPTATDLNKLIKTIKSQFDSFYSTVSGEPRKYIDNSINLLDALLAHNKKQ